jgi:23S rRNA pseudouridine1911/1915/1917 synthase
MEIITEKKFRFEIPEGKRKERLDIFLTHSIENSTRSKVQNLIKNGLVQVNGKPAKPSYQLIPGDIIEVRIPVNPRPAQTLPEPIPLNVIYEDDDVIVINKPAGMVVHPALGNYTGTLVNALLYYTKNLSSTNTVERAGIVHRIDKNTSGLLVVAKNDVAHAKLAKQFSAHSIEREYWAIVWGHFKSLEGVIETKIGRSKSDRKKFAVVEDGKEAVTYYYVLEEFEYLTLLRLKLKTGRTHQIRVHLSHINHPVFGDPTYGGRKIHYSNVTSRIKQEVENLLEIMKHQALHAKTLGFLHPTTNEFVKFDSDLPEDMKLLLEKLRAKKSTNI